MRRAGTIVLGLVLVAATARAAAPSRIIGKYAQFRPSTNPLKSEYGTSMGYGGEINFSLSNYVDLWLGAMHHPQQNQATPVASASLTPIDAGIKIKIPVYFLGTPYFGVGGVYSTYTERAADVESSFDGLGYCLQVGMVIPPCSGEACRESLFSIDLFLNYSSCEIAVRGRTIDVGGLRIGLGWGLGF